MDINDRGVGWTVGLVVFGLLLATGALAIGITAGADQPTGEDVLNETASQYEDADGILTQGTVTVETENYTTTSGFEVIATGNNETLVSVTTDNGTFTTAATEEFVWATADDAQAYFYADDDGVGVYTLSGLEIVEIDQDNFPDEDELPEELSALDDLNKSAIEADLDEQLAEFGNMSVTELDELTDDELAAQVPAVENISADEFNASVINETVAGDLPGAENASAFPTEAELEAALADAELPDEFEADVSDAVEELSTINSTDELRAAVSENVTADLVETTTLDGTEVHVVSVTHTDAEGELRYWIATETNAIVQQELTHPDATVTVEADTEFDPEVQDSTFEPPATTPDELTSFDALQERTFFDAAGADSLTASVDNTTETYTFESGTVVSVPVADGQLANARYDGDRTVTLAETDTPLPLSGGEFDNESVIEQTIDGTNVTIVEGSEIETPLSEGDELDADTVSVATWTTDETVVILATDGGPDQAAAATTAVLEG